jgi:phosphatidylinositol glycan class W
MAQSMFKAAKSSSILILIGLLRLISLKSTDYVEHVSEYGVHWNFLFTIAAVKVLCAPICVYIGNNALSMFVFAFAVGRSYQYWLENGLADFMLSEERDLSNLLSANKEGVYSVIGYCSIYLAMRAICLGLSSILN